MVLEFIPKPNNKVKCRGEKMIKSMTLGVKKKKQQRNNELILSDSSVLWTLGLINQ